MARAKAETLLSRASEERVMGAPFKDGSPVRKGYWKQQRTGPDCARLKLTGSIDLIRQLLLFGTVIF
jgi:hypothetical protein